jgi:hypothetical protein
MVIRYAWHIHEYTIAGKKKDAIRRNIIDSCCDELKNNFYRFIDDDGKLTLAIYLDYDDVEWIQLHYCLYCGTKIDRVISEEVGK